LDDSSRWIRHPLLHIAARRLLHAHAMSLPHVLADILSTGSSGREAGHLLQRQLGDDNSVQLFIDSVRFTWSGFSRMRRYWNGLLSKKRRTDNAYLHCLRGSTDYRI